MVKIEGKIKFQTTRPLSQATGMEMWGMGSRFVALPGHGGKTYQLTIAGEAEDDLLDGITAIIQTIEQHVLADGHNEATILEVNMQARV